MYIEFIILKDKYAHNTKKARNVFKQYAPWLILR